MIATRWGAQNHHRKLPLHSVYRRVVQNRVRSRGIQSIHWEVRGSNDDRAQLMVRNMYAVMKLRSKLRSCNTFIFKWHYRSCINPVHYDIYETWTWCETNIYTFSLSEQNTEYTSTNKMFQISTTGSPSTIVTCSNYWTTKQNKTIGSRDAKQIIRCCCAASDTSAGMSKAIHGWIRRRFIINQTVNGTNQTGSRVI